MSSGLQIFLSLTYIREQMLSHTHSVYVCLFIIIFRKDYQFLRQVLEKLNSFPVKIIINKSFNFFPISPQSILHISWESSVRSIMETSGTEKRSLRKPRQMPDYLEGI